MISPLKELMETGVISPEEFEESREHANELVKFVEEHTFKEHGMSVADLKGKLAMMVDNHFNLPTYKNLSNEQRESEKTHFLTLYFAQIAHTNPSFRGSVNSQIRKQRKELDATKRAEWKIPKWVEKEAWQRECQKKAKARKKDQRKRKNEQAKLKSQIAQQKPPTKDKAIDKMTQKSVSVDNEISETTETSEKKKNEKSLDEKKDIEKSQSKLCSSDKQIETPKKVLAEQTEDENFLVDLGLLKIDETGEGKENDNSPDHKGPVARAEKNNNLHLNNLNIQKVLETTKRLEDIANRFKLS